MGRALRTRFSRELVGADVISFTTAALNLELASRIKRQEKWQKIMHRNDWFQKKAVKTLRKLANTKRSAPRLTESADSDVFEKVVFSYSYAAKEIFKAAKSLGFKTVLGQIDPGPLEIKLVNELELKHGVPLSASPPESYWQSWRDECDLADVIVANSQWSKTLLVETGIQEEKLKVVPLVFDKRMHSPIDEFAKFDSTRPLRVLFLGQVIARKGVIEMADAARLTTDLPVKWTVVGDGDPRLMNQLDELQNVELVGPVNRDQVGKYYRDHDVFILPTHSDGFALTQLEAAAYGMPLIASKFCGDVVKHMHDGILLSEVTPEAIYGAIKTLLDPKAFNLFRQNMRNRPPSTIDQLAANLKQVIQCT